MNGNSKLLVPAVVVGLFLAAHVVVPLVWGDFYPFTSAPMFRDRPEQYCNYHVFAPDGTELLQEDWLVQRVYDGNPVGYGVGVTPPAVIEQEFGMVHERQKIQEHILRQFKGRATSHKFVDVHQQIFGPQDNGTIGLSKVITWRIDRPTP